MRALTYDRYGACDVLAVREVPAPPARRGEVLVRVRAAALNPKDVLVRSGRFRILSGGRFPKVMGLDLAGEVVAAAPGVRGFAPGDPVFGFLSGFSALRGTVAELASVPARWLAPLPRGATFEDAAAVPLVASTALQALRDVARVRPGDRVCIHGASGGVGTAAIQIAKALGAHVTTTSGAASRPLCLSLGADEALDREADDAFSGERVFEIVLDAYGDRSLAHARRALGPAGIYVTTVPSRRIFLDAARTLAARRRARFVSVRPVRRDLEAIARLVEEGRLRPVVDRVVPLADAVDAVRRLETRHAHGKVVVRVA